MKKHLISYLFILVLSFTSDLFCVNRTMTIDAVTLASIRSACLTTGFDPLIKTYWESYTRATREDESYNPEYGNRDYTDSFGLEYKAYLAYQLVLGGDTYNELSDIRNYLYGFPWQTYQRALHHPLIAANSVPVDPIGGEIVPIDWDSLIDYDPAWYSLEAYSRGRELSYNLLFLSFMIDMLYYAHDVSDINAAAKMDSILTKFNDHLQWICESFFTDSQAVWDTLGWQRDASTPYPLGLCYDDFPAEDNGSAYRMPMIGNDVNRFVLMCGLGYGAIVTGVNNPENIDFSNSSSLINFVKHEFVSDTEYPAGSGCYGMNDYLVTKTGMFIAGITYQNRVLYLTPLFLTALNRVNGINLYNSSNAWNCDLVPKMVNSVLVRIDPELQHILQEDDWRYDGTISGGYNLDYDHSKQIERGLLPFYYQNTDEVDTRKNIRWYVHRLKEKNSNNYPRETWEHDFTSSFMVVMSYRAEADDIEGAAAVPEHYINRNYTNGELTILRSPLTNLVEEYSSSDFKDMNMMTINHENSFTFAHKNDDKTAYQLYLDGKPIIIEGGYRPADSWKEWFRNASSHNLLLINPGRPTTGSDSEEDYLGIGYETDGMSGASMQFEDPSSPIIYGLWQSYRDNPDLFNPARKEYLFSNNDISHLKVSVRYRNNVSTSGYQHNTILPQPGDYPCQVERNFYSVADKYYLVMDRVHQEVENPDGNVYKNQLHFLDDSPGGYLMTAEIDRIGVYKYYYPSNSLLIAMGSSVGGDHYCVRDSLPLGWREWDYVINKRQLRLSHTTSVMSSLTSRMG